MFERVSEIDVCGRRSAYVRSFGISFSLQTLSVQNEVATDERILQSDASVRLADVSVVCVSV
jgi:hypothetical protein